jgi:DNA-binding response OmpR family regulator
MRVLLIEDHVRLGQAIRSGLAQFGFGVDIFLTAADGVAAVKSMTYSAIVLDLGLPDQDGLEILADLQRNNPSTPILILTARDATNDRVTGLDAGADDYVVKPFAIAELAARLRALLRRPERSGAALLTVGKLRLDAVTRQVTLNDSIVRFSTREVEALEILIRREGQVTSREILEGGLYGLGRIVSPNTVEVLISRLRRRLRQIDAGCDIHTLHGIGYLLKEQRA